jgi:phage tail-like protein
MSNDRRSFLKHVGTGAAAAAAIAKLSEQSTGAADKITDFRVLSAAPAKDQLKIAFALDGEFAGWIDSFEGGSARGTVVEEKQGTDGVVRKHISGVKYEDITITCGTAMSKAFYDWIASSFDHKHSRKNGAIVAWDFDKKTAQIREFADALLTEVGFPALDASSKDPAFMTLKFSPEYTRGSKHDAADVQAPFNMEQKHFSPAEFRLTIDGMAEAKVNKIDAITVKQTTVEDAVGEQRDYSKEPGKLEVPNLKITLAEFYAQDFLKWHEDFVIKGNNGQEAEKMATLEFVSPNSPTPLFALSFSGVGIFDVTVNKQSSDSSEQKATTVSPQLYCEEVKLWFPDLLVKSTHQ